MHPLTSRQIAQLMSIVKYWFADLGILLAKLKIMSEFA